MAKQSRQQHLYLENLEKALFTIQFSDDSWMFLKPVYAHFDTLEPADDTFLEMIGT